MQATQEQTTQEQMTTCMMYSALEGETSLRDIQFPIKDIPKDTDTDPIWRYGVRAKFYGLSSNRNRNDEYRAVLKAYQIKAVS